MDTLKYQEFTWLQASLEHDKRIVEQFEQVLERLREARATTPADTQGSRLLGDAIEQTRSILDSLTSYLRVFDEDQTESLLRTVT